MYFALKSNVWQCSKFRADKNSGKIQQIWNVTHDDYLVLFYAFLYNNTPRNSKEMFKSPLFISKTSKCFKVQHWLCVNTVFGITTPILHNQLLHTSQDKMTSPMTLSLRLCPLIILLLLEHLYSTGLMDSILNLPEFRIFPEIFNTDL